ncbi:hypothetical protein [Rheinheimera mangrovi]|uniref:hypothetical protein n=1 Tax=Rheinheimera mangrovi TaxID=2498451 RepID=UPI000F8ED69A|nr:hypothetical protein [Rheinheimera mangrovi]
MRTGLIIVGLLCCQNSSATEVTWLKTDWPPHQITSGAHAEQGTFDLLLKQLIAQLPHITHQVQVVNLPRLEQAFRQNSKSVCGFGSVFTEERAKNRWYSKAVAVLPGLAAHFRLSAEIKSHPAVQANGTVDVHQLVQDTQLTGAYQPNRFYPPSVMAATRYANLIPHDFTSEINAAALLLSKRVDYVIEYPERMVFYLKQKKQSSGIESVIVADASPYVVSYITCNKSEQGQQIIKHIDTALMALWQTEAYRQSMFSWIDQADQKALEPAFLSVKLQVINAQ